MSLLKGKNVQLRALEPEDLEFVYAIENDLDYWHLGDTIAPFSKFAIKEYLESALLDIYTTKQLRLVIETNQGMSVGLIDLFDFDHFHKRAGVGIIIHDEENRSKGFGNEAVSLLCEYAQTQLQLHQLYCNVSSSNIKSIELFEKLGFVKIGEKIDWRWSLEGYQNEWLMQRIF